MPTKIYSPESYPTMLNAIWTWANNSTPSNCTVLWANQSTPLGTNSPAPTMPFVRLQITTAPVIIGQLEYRMSKYPVLQIASALPSTLYSATINSTQYSYTSSSSDTAQGIQSGLLAAMSSGVPTAVALNATSNANPYGIDLGILPNTLSCSSNLTSIQAQYAYGTAQATLAVDVFYNDITTQGQLIQQLMAGLEAQETTELLDNASVGFVDRLNIRSIPIVQGAKWTLRDGFDARVSMPVRYTSFIYTIDSFPISSVSGSVHN